MPRKKVVDANIMALRNEGLTLKQIAICLNLDPITVAKHLSKFKRKQNLQIDLEPCKIKLPPEDLVKITCDIIVECYSLSNQPKIGKILIEWLAYVSDSLLEPLIESFHEAIIDPKHAKYISSLESGLEHVLEILCRCPESKK